MRPTGRLLCNNDYNLHPKFYEAFLATLAAMGFGQTELPVLYRACSEDPDGITTMRGTHGTGTAGGCVSRTAADPNHVEPTARRIRGLVRAAGSSPRGHRPWPLPLPVGPLTVDDGLVDSPDPPDVLVQRLRDVFTPSAERCSRPAGTRGFGIVIGK